MIALMKRAHEVNLVPYTTMSDHLQVGYSTVMRWKRRYNNNERIIGTPGPKKTEKINLQALATQIDQMKHGIKKTMGTTQLYKDQKNKISRRDLQALVRVARQDRNMAKYQIEWIAPGVIWSIDDTK